MSLYTDLLKKFNGFHEFHDSDISLKSLKVLAKAINAFQEEVKNEKGIFVKIPPHFLLRMTASFDTDQIAVILNTFKSVVLEGNASWEYEITKVWDGRQELKDIFEKFFLVYKFHGSKRVDLISSGIPGERKSNRSKGIIGKTQSQKKKILAEQKESSKEDRREAKKAKKALKRQLRSGGRR